MLKPRRGGFGKGVTFINSFATLRDIIDYIHSTVRTTPDKAYMLERFYENGLDKWVGTTLINGELMYGYRKRKTRLAEIGNGFQKVYDADEIGGEVDGCEVPQLYKEEALKAYQAIGAEIIGFDMVFNRGQPIIIDENTFPGYYEEIFKQVGRDSAEEFYKLIVSEVNKICGTPQLVVDNSISSVLRLTDARCHPDSWLFRISRAHPFEWMSEERP